MKKISFVIPCYGSENTIEFVIDEIINTVSQRQEYDYEIVAVNDASPDNVLEVLKDIAKKNKKVKVIDLARNFGKHSALMAGFSEISGNYIVCLDDDGQCPANRVWDLIDPLDSDECDVTLAQYVCKKQSRFKNFGSKVNSFMSHILLGKPKALKFENFYGLKRFIVDEIKNYTNPYPYMEGLILRSTRRIKNVLMEERERFEGNGNFTFKKSLSLWLNGFTAFSVKPLRISSIIGIICALIGFVYGLVIIIRKLFFNNIVIMGYSSLIAITLFIGGAIMIMLGLIGEYIGRIYICINDSPQFIIRGKINLEGKKDDEQS